jgi:hypothetical protein
MESRISMDEADSSLQDLTAYEKAIRNKMKGKRNLPYSWMDIAGNYFILNFMIMIFLKLTDYFYMLCRM